MGTEDRSKVLFHYTFSLPIYVHASKAFVLCLIRSQHNHTYSHFVFSSFHSAWFFLCIVKERVDASVRLHPLLLCCLVHTMISLLRNSKEEEKRPLTSGLANMDFLGQLQLLDTPVLEEVPLSCFTISRRGGQRKKKEKVTAPA